MIRAAAADDLPAILTMGEAFFNEAGWPHLTTWDARSTETFLTNLMNGTIEGGVIVAEHEGHIVGMTAFICFPFYFNFAEKCAQELFWYARADNRWGIGAAMFDELERCAAEHGAKIMTMAAVSGLRDKALARFYRRRGYVASELTFMKRITP